jgi:hypothetical protein
VSAAIKRSPASVSGLSLHASRRAPLDPALVDGGVLTLHAAEQLASLRAPAMVLANEELHARRAERDQQA